MESTQFDELAGRIEGLSRAVLVLAWTMERETDMDGLSLSQDWRESVKPDSNSHTQRIARATLHELAQALDDERKRLQELAYQAALKRIDASQGKGPG